MTRKKYTGPPNTFRRPRKGDRLKASDVANMQASIAEMQSKPGESMRQTIEMVRVPSDIATDTSVDCFIQGYDVATTAFSDIGSHAKRAVYNPYADTITTGIIPVVRVGGAVVPVRGGGGGAKLAKTPSGGIDGATLSSGEYTLGSATCVVYEITVVSGVRKASATSDSIVVSNSVPIKIKGDALIHVKKIDGEYLVDVEPCTITYGGTP